MTPAAWISIFGLIITVVLAIITFVYWAGGVTAKLGILIKNVDDLKVDVADYKKNCFTKEDAAIKLTEAHAEHNSIREKTTAQTEALWAKYDKMKKAIGKLFFKNSMDVVQEDL